MVTRRGGGSSGRRSTRGTWRRFSLIWGGREMSAKPHGRHQMYQLVSLQYSHRATEQHFVEACRGSKRQRLWGFVLGKVSIRCCRPWQRDASCEELRNCSPVCFFFSFDLRWGLWAWSSILPHHLARIESREGGSVQEEEIEWRQKNRESKSAWQKICACCFGRLQFSGRSQKISGLSYRRRAGRSLSIRRPRRPPFWRGIALSVPGSTAANERPPFNCPGSARAPARRAR